MHIRSPRSVLAASLGSLAMVLMVFPSAFSEELKGPLGHPRLYFQHQDLESLRGDRATGVRATIWRNMEAWGDWCCQQAPRQEWIPTLEHDPQYENLYDRFYAAMHDTAVLEHLALTSALSDPADDRFFPAAREWALAVARVWHQEAGNQPDASKAYAVLRVMKSLAVAYDALYERLTESERNEIRQTLLAVGNAYFVFFQQPTTAGAGYNKHHGSVDAAPFGIMALALLGESPEAANWLANAIEKHTEYLLPQALTPSGTNEQSSNFWASTLQYRILFVEPLKRVTGRDLFAEFPESLPKNIALAAVAAGQPRGLRFNEPNRSVLFGPSYGQIDYWSPVMLYLARHHRNSTLQHLALWDESLGSLQRTRYITPQRGEELLFAFGPYCYLWYDQTVAAGAESTMPLSFEFPEPEVNEVYMRASYDSGAIVAGMKKGGLVIHAGGRAVFVDLLKVADVNAPAEAFHDTKLADDGQTAVITCSGPQEAGLKVQRVELRRPGELQIERRASQPLTWWHQGEPRREGKAWVWADGTRVEVTQGSVLAVQGGGYVDEKKHYGGMSFADPHPFAYDTVTIAPEEGGIGLVITGPAEAAPTTSLEKTTNE